MSFIRPEIQETFARWRMTLISMGVACLGAYFLASGGPILKFVGLVLLLIGAALVAVEIRRARFPEAGTGPGLLDVDERRITYYGPGGGASMSLEDVTRIEVATNSLGPFASDMFWVFTDGSGNQLMFPSDAMGADQVFNALAAFEGVNYEAVIDASGTTDKSLVLVWGAEPQRLG